MYGRFFEGFSVVLLPYTILYTRARDGRSSRPTKFSPQTMRRLVAWHSMIKSKYNVSFFSQ
jgi:hypothetical protein